MTAHPDKGGNEEEYKKIIETYEVLGNPHQRLKYELGLLREHYQYIEPEGKKTIYNPDEKIKDDLVWKIIETLEWELKVNDLEQEELSKYGGNKLTTRFKDSSGNIIGPNEFCLSWIRYK